MNITNNEKDINHNYSVNWITKKIMENKYKNKDISIHLRRLFL